VWEVTNNPSSNNENFRDIIIHPDQQGILVLGSRYIGSVAYTWIINYDLEGNILWEQLVNPDPYVYDSFYGRQIDALPSAGESFYLAAESRHGEYPDYIETTWLLEMNSLGEVTWGLQIPDYNAPVAFSLAEADRLAMIGRIERVYPTPDLYSIAHFTDFAGYTVLVYPQGLHIQIPPEGDTFTYYATVTNSGEPSTKDIWVGIVHQPTQNPVITRVWHDVFFDAEQARTRIMNQTIPGEAPPGEYELTVHVGDYPWDSQDRGSFTFRKLAGGNEADMTVFQHPERWLVTSEVVDEP